MVLAVCSLLFVVVPNVVRVAVGVVVIVLIGTGRRLEGVEGSVSHLRGVV